MTSFRLRGVVAIAFVSAVLVLIAGIAGATSAPQSIPFGQDWTNTGLITTNDDWSGVPGVIGYRGDGLPSANDVDPQTVPRTARRRPSTSTPTDQPGPFTTGGVSEFEITNPAVALQGPARRSPVCRLPRNTTGASNIGVATTCATSTARSTTPFSRSPFSTGRRYGRFTNVPAGYVADATTGPSLATLVTPVSAALPAAVNNQSQSDPRPDYERRRKRRVGRYRRRLDHRQRTRPSTRRGDHVSGERCRGVPTTADITVDFSEPVATAAGWYSISCTSSGAHTATQSGGPQTYTLNPDADFVMGENCSVTVDASKITDVDTDDPPDQMAANHVFSFTTTLPVTQISEVQGAGHLSPFAGQLRKVEGIVIAERFSNVWLQDATPDGNPATSEGILVFGSSVADAVAVGDRVHVTGTVAEFRPGCTPSCDPASSAFDNLSITELASPGLAVTNLGPASVPAATVIGIGGRMPPRVVIDNDATGSVETSGVFDPAQDGIDFYESLESMLVQVNNAVTVGPTSNFREIWVVGDNGVNATMDTSRGGVRIRDVDPDTLGDYRNGDFNPERIQLDDVIAPTPDVHVRDRFPAAIVGVLSYDFANFELLPLTSPVAVSGGLQRETTAGTAPRRALRRDLQRREPRPVRRSDDSAAGTDHRPEPPLAGSDRDRGDAGQQRRRQRRDDRGEPVLASPHQRHRGRAADRRTTSGRSTRRTTRTAASPAGTSASASSSARIAGSPSSIGRAATRRHRRASSARTARPHLTLSPGRVDPGNSAWTATRKPLAGEFTWRGETFFAIVNHFSSKGGDDPLFGRHQPPVRVSEIARHQQAASVNAFVQQILAVERNANVIVLGDINDFEFSETTSILEGDELTSLMRRLPPRERYSYVFEGNSQVLDQILASQGALTPAARLRRRARQRRVLRPGQRPRALGRPFRPRR